MVSPALLPPPSEAEGDPGGGAGGGADHGHEHGASMLGQVGRDAAAAAAAAAVGVGEQTTKDAAPNAERAGAARAAAHTSIAASVAARKPRPPSSAERRERRRALEVARPSRQVRQLSEAVEEDAEAVFAGADAHLAAHGITKASVESATAEEAVMMLRDFGLGHPHVADAALRRLHALIEAVMEATNGTMGCHEQLMSAVVASDGFESVVGLMRSREREEALQASGCRMLAQYCQGEVACQRAVEAGAFGALAAALATHATDRHVLRWGALAVLSLTQDSAARARLAVMDGVEKALRGPPGGGVWSAVAPPKVVATVELARRYLAMYVQLWESPRSRHTRRAQQPSAPPGAAPTSTSSTRNANAPAGADGKEDKEEEAGRRPRVGKSRWATVASASTLLVRAEALKTRLAQNLAKMGDLFYTWDTDGDGTIDRREFHAAVQSFGMSEPEQVCDLVFNEFDEDRSGAVDYSEYMLKMLRDALVRDRQRIIDLFRQWDEDHSGAISKGEFTTGVRKAGFDARPAELEAMFDELDADGSGELEYRELLAKLQWYEATKNRQASPGYYDL